MTDMIAVVQVDPSAEVVQADPRAEPALGMPSACASGGCGSPDEQAPRAAPITVGAEVRVNGKVIAPEAIAEEIQHHPGADGDTAWVAAARALIVRELLLQEASRRDILPSPEEDEQGRRETGEEALIRALLDQALEPSLPTADECRRFYDGQRVRFRTPDLFEPSHILIEPADDTAQARAVAEQQARAIASEVGDDPQAFAIAAREFSKCPTAHQDGSLGQIRRGEIAPGLQAALEALREGTTCREPVRSRFGWHVVRLQRRIEGRILPFETVENKIGEMLEARAWSAAAARYVAELAQAAAIEGVSIAPPAMDPGGESDGNGR